MKHILRDYLRPFASKFIVSTGMAKGTEEALSLVWSGPTEHLVYLQSRLFSSETAVIDHIVRRPLCRLPKMLAEFKPSLAAIVMDYRQASEMRRPGDLIIPLWVDCRVDLEETRSYANSKSLGADLRTIRKYELDWEISNSRRDFAAFYDRFYVPTVTASHGRAAILADKTERLKLFDAGAIDLLRVRHDNRVIAAVTIDYRQKAPVLRDSGVLDGLAELKRYGTVAALYLFSMDYLASKGFREVGLGLSRSFLDDGVLTFKRKFRPVVRPGFDQCMLVRTGTLNPTTRTILLSSPCFSWQAKALHRTYFSDAASTVRSAGHSRSGSDWNFGVERELTFDISGEDVRLLACPHDLAKVS